MVKEADRSGRSGIWIIPTMLYPSIRELGSDETVSYSND